MRGAALFVLAFALQTSFARFPVPGAGLLDLVLVAVVYVALTAGPTAGLLAGALAGLAQDTLASTGVSVISTGSGTVTARSIIGIGGLAKTVIGFVTGIVGTQFIIARPLPRALVFFTATFAHAIMFIGLYAVLSPGYGTLSYSTMVSQAGANALAGVLMFQVAEFIPGFLDRRRSMSGRMRINRRLD